MAAGVCLLFPANRGGAQSEASAKVEYIASVKPTANEQGLPTAIGSGFLGVYMRGDTMYGWGATLENMVRYAYSPMPNTEILGGPRWMRSAMYDLVVKAGRPVTGDQNRMLLRAVLAERFHLGVHTEDRETNAYVLEVSRNGSRLQEVTGPQGDVRPPRLSPF